MNFLKKSLLLSTVLVWGIHGSLAMEALVRDEIETSSRISSFKPCFVKTEPAILPCGGGQTTTRNRWLVWSTDKGEMIRYQQDIHGGESFLPRFSTCPLMGHCSVHDLTELERYKTRLIEIQKNLEPYRGEQKKKEELLYLEIQIKKMKLEKLSKKNTDN